MTMPSPARRDLSRGERYNIHLLRVADLYQEIPQELIEYRGVFEIDRMAAARDCAQARIGQCRRERFDDVRPDQRILLANHAQYRHREAALYSGEIVAQTDYPHASVGGRP